MYYYNKPKLIEPKILKYLINKNQNNNNINISNNNNNNNNYYNFCYSLCSKLYILLSFICKHLYILFEANYFFLLIVFVCLILLYIRYSDVNKKRKKNIK